MAKKLQNSLLCYRFLIESYNDGYVWLVGSHWMSKPLNKSTIEVHFLKEGYQSSHTMLKRNILSAGLSDNQLQIYHNYILVRNIKIYKWHHMCIS